MKVIPLDPEREPIRGTAAREARRQRYQRIEDIKAVIDIYEDRIAELRTEARRLYKLNQ